MINEIELQKLREELRLGLRKYNGIDKIRFDMSHEMLEKLIFLQDEEGRKTFAFDFNLIKKIDLGGVSFDDASVEYVDFTGSKGAVINPQTVYGKSLLGAKLADAEIKGTFDGVNIRGADFTGSKGEAVINPQTVFLGSLVGTTLSDVKLKECDYEYNGIIHKELIKKLLGIDK